MGSARQRSLACASPLSCPVLGAPLASLGVVWEDDHEPDARDSDLIVQWEQLGGHGELLLAVPVLQVDLDLVLASAPVVVQNSLADGGGVRGVEPAECHAEVVAGRHSGGQALEGLEVCDIGRIAWLLHVLDPVLLGKVPPVVLVAIHAVQLVPGEQHVQHRRPQVGHHARAHVERVAHVDQPRLQLVHDLALQLLHTVLGQLGAQAARGVEGHGVRAHVAHLGEQQRHPRRVLLVALVGAEVVRDLGWVPQDGGAASLYVDPQVLVVEHGGDAAVGHDRLPLALQHGADEAHALLVRGRGHKLGLLGGDAGALLLRCPLTLQVPLDLQPTHHLVLRHPPPPVARAGLGQEDLVQLHVRVLLLLDHAQNVLLIQQLLTLPVVGEVGLGLLLALPVVLVLAPPPPPLALLAPRVTIRAVPPGFEHVAAPSRHLPELHRTAVGVPLALRLPRRPVVVLAGHDPEVLHLLQHRRVALLRPLRGAHHEVGVQADAQEEVAQQEGVVAHGAPPRVQHEVGRVHAVRVVLVRLAVRAVALCELDGAHKVEHQLGRVGPVPRLLERLEAKVLVQGDGHVLGRHERLQEGGQQRRLAVLVGADDQPVVGPALGLLQHALPRRPAAHAHVRLELGHRVAAAAGDAVVAHLAHAGLVAAAEAHARRLLAPVRLVVVVGQQHQVAQQPPPPLVALQQVDHVALARLRAAEPSLHEHGRLHHGVRVRQLDAPAVDARAHLVLHQARVPLALALLDLDALERVLGHWPVVAHAARDLVQVQTAGAEVVAGAALVVVPHVDAHVGELGHVIHRRELLVAAHVEVERLLEHGVQRLPLDARQLPLPAPLERHEGVREAVLVRRRQRGAADDLDGEVRVVVRREVAQLWRVQLAALHELLPQRRLGHDEVHLPLDLARGQQVLLLHRAPLFVHHAVHEQVAQL
mmetsp:Transcript_8153/g.25647  ORF Transcript_8153/g.25647 Transcript_8153/m.25647 type:complete len:927 (+) Transcript_8153:65-2845(+)